MASSDSQVTPISPQENAALKLSDPTTIDDTATYTYGVANFSVATYKTYIQDILSPGNPAHFPNDSSGQYVPTSTPFILELDGTGFDVPGQSVEPFKIYIEIDGYVANIPPLPTSTNLSLGNAFGYTVHSATAIWIYFNRLTFQQIWFAADWNNNNASVPFAPTANDVGLFNGIDSPTLRQLEAGTGNYPLINGITECNLYVALNDGSFLFEPSFFVANDFKSIDIDLVQSPFIITVAGNTNKDVITPVLTNNNGSVVSSINLYGHDLSASTSSVMMVKTSSTLLKSNPSAIPANILSATQDAATLKAAGAATIANLDYFKVGYYLTALTPETLVGPYTLTAYPYIAADGTQANSGPQGFIPFNNLSTYYTFNINSLPADTYTVVVYDQTTGAYSSAPYPITINNQKRGLQIQDVKPSPVVLQAPTFTVDGFNFPTTDDLSHLLSFTVAITSLSSPDVALDPTASLTITSASPANDVDGNGTITLVSDTQFKANFTNFNPTTAMLEGDVLLSIQVNYPLAFTKTSDTQYSKPLIIKSAPVIQFLTNTLSNPPPGAYPQSLVSVDQTTGKVIAYGVIQDQLYIVGKNFSTGNKNDVSVLINGTAQEVADVIPWPPANALSAIVLTIDPDNIKGNATVQVTVAGISSEPFIFTPTFNMQQVTKNAQGTFSSVVLADQTIDTDVFKSILPYNQFDQSTLLNSTNTKVASSVKLTLTNKTSKKSITVNADLTTPTALTFLPDQVVIPSGTKLVPTALGGSLTPTFSFFNLFNINISTPKIHQIQHANGNYQNATYKNGEQMTVVGNGFVNGMRYNINDTIWQPIDTLYGITNINNTLYQTFTVTVPPGSSGETTATIKISNDNAQQVQSINTAGKQNGGYKVGTMVVNDKYAPLLQINQRLPAGIKMYAKGTQNTMTDLIDANMSIYSQITPFLGGFKTLLIIIRVVVCIIDVICALINPFKLIVAIIALMDCIIDLLSLFPQLAVPIMILSFIQNFVGFLQVFITQIEAYALSIVNSQLALVKAKVSQDLSSLASAEQQAFAATKQMDDAVALLQPALQIIQIFKDLLNFAMHFPCAANQGAQCPPDNVQQMIKEMVGNSTVPADTYVVNAGSLVRINGIVTATTTAQNNLMVGNQFMITPGEQAFPTGTKTVVTVIDGYNFTYTEAGINGTSTITENVGTLVNSDQQNTLATMFCQAVAIQTTTLQTMPCFNGLDGFGNPMPPCIPGTTSIIPPVTPILPDISGTMECLNNLTAQIETALNAGQTFITTPAQGQALVTAYQQCVQNLIDQSSQAMGDVCVLAVSALNSDLTVSPPGPNIFDATDDFVRTQIGLPTTDPNDAQDAGLVIDLATLNSVGSIPSSVSTIGGNTTSAANFGLKQDIYTPVIVQTTNKSGQRQKGNTIYFNADNSDVGTLITPGDIFEIVGGTFNGLQFPILAVQPVFTAVRLTCKLDITYEQSLQVGNQQLPEDLSGFDVKVIAHLAGNDAVAVIPADNISMATIQVMARDFHGHLIGPGLANKVSFTLESGEAMFVPITPSSTTDVTGTIQESGDFYIANLKSNCTGIVIVSAAMCNIAFVDIGYHANDPAHAITTRLKTVKIVFAPPIPKPVSNSFISFDKPQVPGTHTAN
jgi:hypothetical protein